MVIADVDQDGHETVSCKRGDGMGITLLRRAGFPALVISSEVNPVVRARCGKLDVECVQGVDDKTEDFRRLLEGRAISPESVVFVGNDVNDIGCIRLAGCGFAVADAHPLVLKEADGVLRHRGGDGAVREVCELVLLRIGNDLVYNPSDRR